jgi:GT2 family glycosyltransferase
MNESQSPVIESVEGNDWVRITVCCTSRDVARIETGLDLQAGDRAETLADLDIDGVAVRIGDYYLDLSRSGHRSVSVKLDGATLFSRAFRSMLRARGPANQQTVTSTQATRLATIVPIHNGGKALETCLRSLVSQDLEGARIILVDDASTDRASKAIIDDYSTRPGISVIRNSENLGFVRSVNRALAEISAGPVLLLNSDTYLPTDTLSRMLAHIEADETVGTVTPFSNNAGTFSLPSARATSQMPSTELCEEIAAAAYRLNARQSVDVLDGNGFAMMISERCRKRVGYLSQVFSAGYYEEVEFCLRARMQEFRNVCAADCFVGHHGAVSFGTTRAVRAAENLRLLDRYFPSYRKEYEQMERLDPLVRHRKRIMDAVSWKPERTAADVWKRSHVRLASSLGRAGERRYLLPIAGEIGAAAVRGFFRRIIPVDAASFEAQSLDLELGHKARLVGVMSRDGMNALALTIAGTARVMIEFKPHMGGSNISSFADFERAVIEILGTETPVV